MRAVILLGMASLWVAVSAQGESPLPPGRGADIIQSKCLTCHGTDLIQQQRLARAGWLRELEKMTRWGAVLTEEERNLTADYLATNFGPLPSRADLRSGEDAGAAVFKSRCLGCHGADLTEQQRLGRPAWVREVDKMIRWGAAVSLEEKEPLIDYLAARFRSGTPR
ncbi:MAG: hypothetical protein HY654_01360 [Acidobacteria bacterium]|nr:hypothetical protein [Acidobacteriota bacterium]